MSSWVGWCVVYLKIARSDLSYTDLTRSSLQDYGALLTYVLAHWRDPPDPVELRVNASGWTGERDLHSHRARRLTATLV
jgi:hypothetical protein